MPQRVFLDLRATMPDGMCANHSDAIDRLEKRQMQDAASPLRGNLKSAVAEIIALRILDGSYPPGSTLPTASTRGSIRSRISRRRPVSSEVRPKR